jgi:hypothetical protein
MNNARPHATPTRRKALAWLLAAALPTAVQAQDPPPREASQDEESEGVVRQRPQGQPLDYPLPEIDPARVAAPEAAVRRESLPVPDRWRIMQGLGPERSRWDPYNPNVLKGDMPFEPFKRWGNDWFLVLTGVSDTLLEARRLPTPVGPQSSERPGSLDVFGEGEQTTFNQNLILAAAVIKGNTTFKPPDHEFRLALALNYNRNEAREVRALKIDPRDGRIRIDQHIGLQELFYDKHLRNVSDRYDFDSLRIGVQPFISDFRGFVLQDNAFGVRLFGTRHNNVWQYNLAWLRRMEKDTNSGLNDPNVSLRKDDTLAFNLYRQDFPVFGHTTQLSVLHNDNREGGEVFRNANGFQERPAILGDMRGRDYHVTYLGLSGDGHFGRLNLSTSLYAALGRDERHPLAQRGNDIEAFFGAAELSRDFDWLRLRGTLIVASGDKNPFDGRATGFDAILENPQISGADTSFWIRQAVPLVGGGGVILSGRNSLLPSLRSSKELGQSNFVNPGLTLVGIGADMDLKPELRVVANLAKLDFVETGSLSVLRAQGPISRDIGVDLSAGVQYRPFMSQNIVLNASAAALFPGSAFRQLYADDSVQYSVLLNLILTY